MYKESISAAYVSDMKIQEPPPVYDGDTKNKAENLDRLHAAIKEKLVTTSNTEKLQILTLVPNSWSRKYCSEYFGVSEYLIRSARELKQKKGILAKPSQKHGQAMDQETIDLVHAFYKDGKKDYIIIQKAVHKQRQLVLCDLHELLVAFKEKNPDVKIGFSKFCTLLRKLCATADSSGTHLVCIYATHQNTILLVDALNWEVTYKDLVNKALRKFLEEELSEIDPDSQSHYWQWQTTDRASLVTVTSTCEEYEDTLISAIKPITKHVFSHMSS